MHLINHEGRNEAEAEACRSIVAFCRKEYRGFEYSELTLDFSAMPWMPWDMLCVCFAAGQIVHKRPDIVRLVIGTCREEGHWRERWEHFYRMVEGAAWPARAPELLLPFLDRLRAMEHVTFLVTGLPEDASGGNLLMARDAGRWASAPYVRSWWPWLAPLHSQGFPEFLHNWFQIGMTQAPAGSVRPLTDSTHPNRREHG